MVKGESLVQRIVFATFAIYKLLLMPVASLERLEPFCRNWIKKNPLGYSAREVLADLYRYHGKNIEAKLEYLELVHLNYMTDRDWLHFAEVLFRLGEHKEVIRALSPIIAKYPKDVNANWYLGRSYMEEGNFSEAITHLHLVDAAGKARPKDLWHLGCCYDQIGELDKALRAYSRALHLSPDSAELRKNIASIHVRKGRALSLTDLREAREEFQKALAIDPGNELASAHLELTSQNESF